MKRDVGLDDTARELSAEPAQIADALLDAWNDHDLDRFVALFSPEYTGVDVNDPIPHHGRAELRASAARYFEAFPDLQVTCESVLGDSDRLAILWTVRGTHLGSFMRIPPTHRTVEVRGVAMLTRADGLIRQAVYVWDTAGMLRSLGLLPQL